MVRRSRIEALGLTEEAKSTKPRACMGTENGASAGCQSPGGHKGKGQRAKSALSERYCGATCTDARRCEAAWQTATEQELMR